MSIEHCINVYLLSPQRPTEKVEKVDIFRLSWPWCKVCGVVVSPSRSGLRPLSPKTSENTIFYLVFFIFKIVLHFLPMLLDDQKKTNLAVYVS